MDDEFLFILLGLIVIVGLPIMAIGGFVMSLKLRRRVEDLERAMAVLTGQIGAPVPTVAPAPEPPPAATETAAIVEPSVTEPAPDAQAPPPSSEASFAAEAAPEAGPDTEPAKAATGRRRESLEEAIGARWAVWVGGVALAFGGLFLVRYSIEAGLLGPGARILAGLLFAAGLIGAGEVMRRRGKAAAEPVSSAAPIPAILTAAGTVALFGTIFSAHALYGFIGPAIAFIALGAVGVVTMFAAALHGPWLAGLGLVGAYATPLLVASDEPDPWALTIYLAVIAAAAFGLARLRLWRWLAICASVGSLLWGLVLAGPMQTTEPLAGLAHLLILAALVIGVIGVGPHRQDEADSPIDVFALAVMLGVAALALFAIHVAWFSNAALAAAYVTAAALFATGLAVPALAPAAGIAAALAVGLATLWPVIAQSLAEPTTVIADMTIFAAAMPESASLYAVLVAVSGVALFAGTSLVADRRSELRFAAALSLALAGTAGPLLLLAIAYVRLTSFTANLVFGAIGLAAAAILAAGANRFLARATAPDAPLGAVASVYAAAATGALALSLTMILAGSTLTTAFALAALGTAWIASLRPLPALRWSAVALTLLVLLRGGGAWTVIGDVMSTFPTWSDIALRYAIPAVAIGLGGVLLRRRATDAPAGFLDSAAILLATGGACLSIRLLIHGEEGALAARVDLLEAGLYVALFLAMAIGFARGALTTRNPVHRIAAPISIVLALALALGGPLLLFNPVLTGDAVPGGSVLNGLLAGLAVPAVLAALARLVWSRIAAMDHAPPSAPLFATAAGIIAGLLAFLYVSMQTRFLMRSGDMSFVDMTTPESYAYSAVWLVFGIGLLAAGLLFRSKAARLASGLVILLTVAKVFLVDMSDLEGVWRALSFIGLGLALIGIGLVYQKLLFGGGRASASPPQETREETQ